MGATAISHCQGNFCSDEHYIEHGAEEAMVQRRVEESPKLGLRIFSTPCAKFEGGALNAQFLGSVGNEFIASGFEKVHGWGCMSARWERSANERTGVLHSSTRSSMPARMQWPQEYRFTAPRHVWRCNIVSQDRAGGVQHHSCMLIIASIPSDRSQAKVELDLKDSVDVAYYASQFNEHLHKACGESDSVPGIRVCAPVGCQVIKSSSEDFATAGQAVIIIPCPFPELRKFVFDGSEDFLEMPQAFFHHAAWLSGSNEFVCDLQGIEDDDNNIILIDPCVLRAPKVTVGNLLSTVAPNATQKENMTQLAPVISPERFDTLHPRCSQLCKAFDPHRRSAYAKRHCGLDVVCGPRGCGV